MPQSSEQSSLSQLGSLLDEQAPPVSPGNPPAPSIGSPRTKWQALSDEQRLLVRRVCSLAALLLFLMAGMWGIFSLVPKSQPDYLSDDMADILDYTLLSDEFNNLPVERRLELIRDLVNRIKTLSSDDSTAMAAFAATIKSQMRRQMERNIKRLAVDTIDIYAKDYAALPPERQEEFLDDAVIGFTRMMEDIAGEKSPLPENDKERLDTLKDQAKRDEERLREGDTRLSSRRAAKFFEFIHNDEENVSDPVQRGRNAKFMRDMTRHLRGQDPSTGKPVQGPG